MSCVQVEQLEPREVQRTWCMTRIFVRFLAVFNRLSLPVDSLMLVMIRLQQIPLLPMDRNLEPKVWRSQCCSAGGGVTGQPQRIICFS